MKLLDCEFADEKVRKFAVQVLDTLHDEELEDFLLQLTQVRKISSTQQLKQYSSFPSSFTCTLSLSLLKKALKFESSHDSALARLLLKRALRNKRIGHFFFWFVRNYWTKHTYSYESSSFVSTTLNRYLRCELYNPLYVPRFAVLLEAYLKGCGEAMLKRFESQVDMQQRLEEIGRMVSTSLSLFLVARQTIRALIYHFVKKHHRTSFIIIILRWKRRVGTMDLRCRVCCKNTSHKTA